ncbi:MAG: DMT family transporter [Planctomycetota bacterium]
MTRDAPDPPRSRAQSILPGLAAITATLIAWSVAPLLIRSFRGVVDPHTNNAFRYAVGALLWAPVLLRQIHGGRLDASVFRRALWPLGFNIIGQVCFTASFYEIDPGLVTFGLRAQIVCVAIAAPLVFPAEKAVLRSPVFLIGIGAVLTGVLTMAALAIGHAGGGDGLASEADRARTIRGVALAIAAGIGYAGYGLGVRKCLDGVPHTTSFAVIGLMTTLGMVVVALVLSPTRGLVGFAIEPADYARLLLAGVIGIGLSHVLFYIAMEKLGVALATGVIQTQPVLVFLGSAAIYSERLTGLQLAFGLLAIAGAIVMLSAKRADQHPVGAHDDHDAESESPDFVSLESEVESRAR